MDKGIDVDALKADAQKLLRLTIRIRKYQQFFNFIRQPKNWLAIALNIAAVVVCIWSIRYGLSRPFDPRLSGIILSVGIIIITRVITDIDVASATISRSLTQISACISPFAGAVIGLGIVHYFTTSISTMMTIITVAAGAVIGFVVYLVITFFVALIISCKITNESGERYKKYYPPIILAILTFTVLLASSFQNVDAQSWKFDRRTGKLVERTVFIWPGSTIERE